MPRPARMWSAALLLAAALALGGCAAGTGESQVTAYEQQGEAVAARVLELIPTALGAQPAAPFAEVRDGGPGFESEGDAVWWQYEQDIQLAAVPGASAAAAEAIAAGLQSDGWTMRRVRETERGDRVADGFRRGDAGEGWYIELTSVRYPEPDAQRLELIIVSPTTVRGPAAPGGAAERREMHQPDGSR
ncbi:MAG: hypothetical protein R2732_01370 [Microbacteriaceae bacterium]|nr:hypothetical protein [Microbacteriaceae bacterium]HQC93004.1 hypothetical protein [Microbacteriaceae bacterium]